MHQDFRLDRWIIQPSLHLIRSVAEHPDSESPESRRLGHKVMSVLVCLAQRPGEVVTREELFEHAWEGAFTTDEALATVVYELRKALDDDARNPSYIETIRKSGYRLIAPVSALPVADEAPAPAADQAPAELRRGRWRWPIRAALPVAATLAMAVSVAMVLLSTWFEPTDSRAPQLSTSAEPQTIRSVAVRPLSSITDECRQDFFADGLTEMLIADLAYLGPLDVIPALDTGNSTPAADHQADAVLEGSVLRTGDRLWISIQLVDSTDRHILWGGTFERELRESLDLQLELSREISYQIVSNVTPESRPWPRVIDPQVTEALQMGSHFLRQGTLEDTEKARGYFSLAIRLDPDHAPAHVGLADTLVAATGGLPAESQAETYRQAQAAAETALEIDAGLPEAHISLASIYFQHQWDWSRAEEHFRRGFTSSVCSVDDSRRYAGYLSAMGRHDEAVTALEHGLDCDPTSKTGHLALAWTYYLARRFDDALAALDRARELDPDYPPIFMLESDVFLAAGHEEQAVRSCQRALELARDGASGDYDARVAQLTEIYRQSGIEGVLRCLISITLEQTPDGDGHLVRLASLEARLGETDVAIEWLRQAFEERHDDLVWIRVDPAFDNLRSHQPFVDLVARLGLDV